MKTGKVVMWSIVTLVIVGGGYFAYQKFAWNKKRAIKILAKYTNLPESSFADQGEQYLIARAKAVQGNMDEFKFEGKNYDTKTGKTK